MEHQLSGRERGSTLVVVLITAVVFSITAVGVLFLSLALTQRAQHSKGRLRASYAAESGLVWAMERLWNDPAYPASSCITVPCPSCTPGQDLTDTLSVDTTQVTITVRNCGPGNEHQLSAKVTY